MRLCPTRVRPFLKWAGGKSRLIPQLTHYLPPELRHGKIRRYVEPFIGGGAMFLHIACVYDVDEFVICDVHDELILCYQTIREDVVSVMELLDEMHKRYIAASEEQRRTMFYAIRQQFNENRTLVCRLQFEPHWIERTAQMIFLNRTCFNGLFRFNSRGEFNVPFGKYTNPKFYDEVNLHTVAQILQDTTILCGDFTVCQQFVDERTFFYFDPPYRPISKTSAFTSYSRHNFDERDQQRLAGFFDCLDSAGAMLMLSNSDPKNEDPHDDFFETLYQNSTISKVMATRFINSKGDRRGRISELVITNY